MRSDWTILQHNLTLTHIGSEQPITERESLHGYNTANGSVQYLEVKSGSGNDFLPDLIGSCHSHNTEHNRPP